MKLALLFALALLFYIPAEYYSKKFGGDPSLKNALALQAGYIASTFVWMAIMYEKKDLFVSSLAWYGIGASASFIIGVVAFGEVLKPHHIVGVALSVVASLCLML